MIVYPAEHDRKKDSLFASVAAAAGGGRRLRIIPLSFRDFPETAERTRLALARAKRQPGNALTRRLKAQLLRGQYNWSRRWFTDHPEDVALCWNGLTGSRMAFMQGAADAGAARLYMELSPFPGRITLDPRGVNAECGLPRDPAPYRNWARDKADLTAWRRLGQDLTARPPRRGDVGQGEGKLPDTPFLFVPLQVPGDSQITLFADWVKDIPGFLAVLARNAHLLPAGWHLRVKEHPSARASLAGVLRDAVTVARGRIVVDNDTDTFAQVRASRGVLTINSSVGLQAFFFDRPVMTTGRAFWALPGLVEPIQSETGLRLALPAVEGLSYDAGLRDAFMTYLDRAYYPKVIEKDGAWSVDPAAVRAILERARRRAA
ncbi:MAG: capsular biosynthesis protein [Rhodobacteraceae bacterium]|nr:capsular biosynthesis protein [Paracoccaceae bacterium]